VSKYNGFMQTSPQVLCPQGAPIYHCFCSFFTDFFGKVVQTGVQSSTLHLHQERQFLFCSQGPKGSAGAIGAEKNLIFSADKFTGGGCKAGSRDGLQT